MNETIKSQQANTATLGNTTMYNLQNKRTLPRDVIKWMQGLDLSYSVKDFRKDLSNGFLIGQIISRYEPGKIPMHAFQNSSNQTRRDNNWNLLALFFTKNQLRKVKIQQNQYAKIKSGNDPRSEQLFEFICRLYSVCTKRNLPEANQTLQLPPTQSKNPNLTASYLLKDDGLEKLQNSQMSNNINQQIKQTHQDRVPTRKISPNVDSPARVDVKGIGVKQQNNNRKMTSKKKSWEAKSESYYEETNPYVQKYVFDYLNQILQQCLSNDDIAPAQIKMIFSKSQAKPTQVLMKNMPMSTKLIDTFFVSVKNSVNQIITVMLKDLNQIWKFFMYFIRMLGYYSSEHTEFYSLIDLLVTFATGGNLNEKKKISKVFMQSLIDALISQAKNATQWRKRQKIMQIIYDFSGRQIDDKKAVLFNLKEKLGSNNTLYFNWLAVLVQDEVSSSGNSKLVQDFIYYAHQNLSSSNSTLRISSLKILSIVSINGWISLIEQYFSQETTMKKIRCIMDFEAIYFACIIYFCLLKNIIDSTEYQTLVKGKSQGSSNTIKVYNPDHERQTQEVKHKVQSISMTIAHLYHNTTSLTTRQVIAKEAVNYISESTPLMMIVVYHMGSLRDLDDFFKQQPCQYQFRTTNITMQPVKIEILKENANDIIADLIKLHDDKRNANIPQLADLTISIKQQLALMNFCLQHLNIKKLNIQLWESIGQKLCKTVAATLCDQKFSQAAWSILQKIYLIIFNYDMKMAYLNVWMAEAMAEILSQHKEGNQIISKIKQFFKQQYKNANIEQVKVSSDQINDVLEDKGFGRLIKVER